jgi:hypothetical protein
VRFYSICNYSQNINHWCTRHSLRTDTKVLRLHPTNLQKAKLLECNNRLRRRIDAWTSIQELYIPGVAVLRTRLDREAHGGDPVVAMDVDLLMSSKTINLVHCNITNLECEWILRHAQAHNTLHTICHNLLLHTCMYQSKDRFSRGQKQQTRSVLLLNNVQSRISSHAAKYCDVRKHLLHLSLKLHKVGWQDILRPLDDTDLRGLSKETRTGEGHVALSWIWQVVCTLHSPWCPIGLRSDS